MSASTHMAFSSSGLRTPGSLYLGAGCRVITVSCKQRHKASYEAIIRVLERAVSRVKPCHPVFQGMTQSEHCPSLTLLFGTLSPEVLDSFSLQKKIISI